MGLHFHASCSSQQPSLKLQQSRLQYLRTLPAATRAYFTEHRLLLTPAYLVATTAMSLSAAATVAWGANTLFVPPAFKPAFLPQRQGLASFNRVPTAGELSPRPWVAMAPFGGTHTRMHRSRSVKMAAEKPKGSGMLQGPNLELMRYACCCNNNKRK